MKLNISFALLAITCLTWFSSCDNDEPDQGSVVGTWILEQRTVSACINPDDNQTETYLCDATTCITIEFKSDGSVVQIAKNSGGTQTSTGTYTNVDGELNVCFVGNTPECTSGIFVLNDEGKILNFSYFEDGCSILMSFNKQ